MASLVKPKFTLFHPWPLLLPGQGIAGAKVSKSDQGSPLCCIKLTINVEACHESCHESPTATQQHARGFILYGGGAGPAH